MDCRCWFWSIERGRMKLTSIALMALLVSAPVWAVPTVVNFDDLSGSGVVADGYAGMTWNGAWLFYDTAQTPYSPSSPFTRIYNGSGLAAASFQWASPVVFDGAFINGRPEAGNVFFNLYNGPTLVATSGSYVPDANDVGQFLSSGFAGLVDRVEVVSGNSLAFFIVDDVTYNSAVSSVPELNRNNMALPLLFTTCLLLALQRRPLSRV